MSDEYLRYSIHGFEKMLKILLVGDSMVGKSSLTAKFTEGGFPENSTPTIGLDFKTKIIKVSSRSIKLLVYDTAGEERFRHISNMYYKNVQGIIFVYDVSNPDSLDGLEKQIQQAIKRLPLEIPMILVGNKVDLTRRVPTSQGQKLAHLYGMKFFETSAKSNLNVDEVFMSLSNSIMGRRDSFKRVKLEKRDSLGKFRIVSTNEKNRDCTHFLDWLWEKITFKE